MEEQGRLTRLKTALVIIGIIFVAGVPAMMLWIWPAGWSWTPRHPEYEQMIIGVYAVLGIFLLRASRDPMQHASLIWFTVWSSLTHGAIMLVQGLADPTDRINLLGDVPALFVVALVLWRLMPRQATR